MVERAPPHDHRACNSRQRGVQRGKVARLPPLRIDALRLVPEKIVVLFSQLPHVSSKRATVHASAVRRDVSGGAGELGLGDLLRSVAWSLRDVGSRAMRAFSVRCTGTPRFCIFSLLSLQPLGALRGSRAHTNGQSQAMVVGGRHVNRPLVCAWNRRCTPPLARREEFALAAQA